METFGPAHMLKSSMGRLYRAVAQDLGLCIAGQLHVFSSGKAPAFLKAMLPAKVVCLSYECTRSSSQLEL
jgi:hypothetical protein